LTKSESKAIDVPIDGIDALGPASGLGEAAIGGHHRRPQLEREVGKGGFFYFNGHYSLKVMILGNKRK
jgi:hypothetical protein